MGITVASRHSFGTSADLHDELKIRSSSAFDPAPRWRSISLVIPSGPGAFFSFVVTSWASSSAMEKGAHAPARWPAHSRQVRAAGWDNLRFATRSIALALTWRETLAYVLTKPSAFCRSVISSFVPSSIAWPSLCSSSVAPSHFFRILESLPRLAGRFRVVDTNSRNCSRVTLSSTARAWSLAAIHRALLPGSSGRISCLAAWRARTASCRSGWRAHGRGSARAPFGMCRFAALWMMPVRRVAASWTDPAGSAPVRAASQSSWKARQSARWWAHLAFLFLGGRASVALMLITIGRWSLPRSGPVAQLALRARAALQAAMSGAEWLPER